MHVEVFPRRIPAEVRAKDTAGQEEGLVVIAQQERSGAFGGLSVGCLPVRNVKWLPICPILVILLRHLVTQSMQETTIFWKRCSMLGRILMIPRDRVRELAAGFMKDLASHYRCVPMLTKVLWDRHQVMEFWLVAEP